MVGIHMYVQTLIVAIYPKSESRERTVASIPASHPLLLDE